MHADFQLEKSLIDSTINHEPTQTDATPFQKDVILRNMIALDNGSAASSAGQDASRTPSASRLHPHALGHHEPRRAPAQERQLGAYSSAVLLSWSTTTNLTDRLHAARLLAGIMQFKEAAAVLGVPARHYRAAELDSRWVTKDMVEAAASHFDVTVEFLQSGVCTTQTDRTAARVARTIDDLETRAWDDEAIVCQRLRSARLAAGLARAGDVVGRFGWKDGTYRSHETGYRPLYTDRLIIYAMSFEVDARSIALGLHS